MLVHEIPMSDPLALSGVSARFDTVMEPGELWEYVCPIGSYIAQGDAMIEADPMAGAMFVPAGRAVLVYPGYEAGQHLAAIVAVAETDGTATLTRMRLVALQATSND